MIDKDNSEWTYCTLKEVTTKITDGSHNPPKGKESGVLMLSAKNVLNNSIEFENGRLISEEDFIVENKRTSIKPGDILLTIVATIGRTAVVPENAPKFTLQRSVAVIKPTINSKYLSYYFQNPNFQKLLKDNAQGTAQKGVYLKTLSNLEVSYPPLSKQQEIVDKIEELLSELDQGKQQLETALQQLKVYRQAVLKSAFEGKLTNPEIKEGELPKGWMWVNMGEVIEKPKYGTSKKCDYGIEGLPVLRIPNIGVGFINTEDLKFAAFEQNEIDSYKLNEGDLLTIRSNGSIDLVGKCALITKREEAYLYAGYLIRLRPLPAKIKPKFLLHVLSSSNLRSQIEFKAKSTSGVNNINTDELKSLVIPLPPLEEQCQIVEEIESRLSVCDKVEETIFQSLQQAETLRLSILKKAFEGKLIQ